MSNPRSNRDEDPQGRPPDDADDEVTPVEASTIAETAVSRRLRPLETLMLTMLALSLLVHTLTIARLLGVRATLRDEITTLAASVEAAKGDSIHYNLPIDQQIPIAMDVPIKRSLTVPVRTEVRIKQDITLPVRTAFGDLNIPVPIDTSIPISTSVPIDFDQTVNISTTVPLKLNVPLQIDLGATELSGYLDRLHQALLDLRGRL